MISNYLEVKDIADRLEVIRERIEQACQKVGRRTEEVTLVGVTKTFPVEVVGAAVEAGLHDLGENRVQELLRKSQTIPGELHDGPVRWHMIGHLQRNKAKDAVACADVCHAVDSYRLADALDKRARLADRVLPCFVQVNVSGEETKSGVKPEDTLVFLEKVSGFENLQFEGLMTLAAPALNPETIRPQFRQLYKLVETADTSSNINLKFLSMGMSGDFEVAIQEGSTHVRIGSAIFGSRT